MKIPENKLSSYLDEKLQNIYVILGSESILIEESLEKIYFKSKSENFTDKETYIIGNQNEWDFLNSSSANFDLFGTKKIIEIKLIGQGPGSKGAIALKEYAKKPDPNILLLVTGEALERKSYTSAWVKALEGAGALISIQPLTQNRLLIWIQEKGKKNDINILKEAGHFLVQRTEGNLVASLQEIHKLALIYPNQDIDIEKMSKSITNSSRFTIFDFSNAFVTGNTKQAIRILESLKIEGVPETLILWTLSRELHNLFKVKHIGSSKGLWGPKYYLDSLEKSAKKIPKIRIQMAFKKIANIDSSIKGLVNQNPWIAIRELTLTF